MASKLRDVFTAAEKCTMAGCLKIGCQGCGCKVLNYADARIDFGQKSNLRGKLEQGWNEKLIKEHEV